MLDHFEQSDNAMDVFPLIRPIIVDAIKQYEIDTGKKENARAALLCVGRFLCLMSEELSDEEIELDIS